MRVVVREREIVVIDRKVKRERVRTRKREREL